MQTWHFIALGMALSLVALVAALLQARADKQAHRPGGVTAQAPLTPQQQAMYWRLMAALPPPAYVVLAQVSLSALLQGKTSAARNSFMQKRADFVLLDKSFKVLAIVELDDASHRHRGDDDFARDALLNGAGYRVLHYAAIPQPAKLLADLRGSIDGVPTTLGGPGSDD